jgi:pimeloyl-ACP methyl ester carboxylesterase
MSAFLEHGDGPPLVLLHGIGGAAHLWDAVPGRRVLAWNQPGYGGTALLPDLTFAALADALARDLDAASVARADIVGHSMGGMIALEFALRHPGRVGRLVLYATTPAFGGRDPAFARDFMAARLGPLDAGLPMAECAAALAGGMCAPGADPAAEPAAVAAMAEVPEATYRATLACLATFDRRADLPRIAAPTVLIAGEEDAVAPPRTMQRMADAIPGARLLIVPGAGHLAHLEQPEAFAAALREALA